MMRARDLWLLAGAQIGGLLFLGVAAWLLACSAENLMRAEAQMSERVTQQATELARHRTANYRLALLVQDVMRVLPPFQGLPDAMTFPDPYDDRLWDAHDRLRREYRGIYTGTQAHGQVRPTRER